jgi:hypothetical protein
MKIVHDPDPRPLRAKAYPPLADQLDAAMKGLAALAKQGIALPDETTSWINQCQAVKDRYPKKVT